MEYYSYDQMINDAVRLKRNYSSIVSCDTIGYSVCKRDIIMLRLGCGHKAFFLSAGIHGRESINTKLLMMIAEYTVRKYYGTRTLNEFSFYIIPLVNPDGYIEAISNSKKYDYKFNHNGVDINRNFPSKLWKSTAVSGKKPASEPETRAVISAFKSHPSFMYIDFHSRGECIYYFRQAMDSNYNKRQHLIADELSKLTGYKLERPENELNLNDSGGNSVHYYSEQYNMPAFTIETLKDDEMFPFDISLAGDVAYLMKDLLYDMTSLFDKVVF